MKKSGSSASSSYQDNKSKTTSATTQKKKPRGECGTSTSTSHTQYFRRDRFEGTIERITSDQYCNISESISGSSDTFQCVHGPEGKQYTEKGLLKRNIKKNLDPIPADSKWTEKCEVEMNWDIVKTLEFLMTDSTGDQQSERMENLLQDFLKISVKGYKIDVLENITVILDYLVENFSRRPILRPYLVELLKNIRKPILLNLSSDIVTYFENIQNYLCYLGYLSIRLNDKDLFDLVADGFVWQLSAPDASRGPGSARLRHVIVTAVPVLFDTVVRMIALANSQKFPIYMDLALLIACDKHESCIQMIKDNIIENVFYRFNPYFPQRELPTYDINPADPQDINLKIGQSTAHISKTLSLLLVLLKAAKQYVDENPSYRLLLPCPDDYAQRCFIWAYRYECRAREHRHERITLTVITSVLLYIYQERLATFSTVLMPDVMSLSVLTELPRRDDWTSTVDFNTSQMDVQFKKILIYLGVEFLKVFPCNKFMIEHRYWLLGLMYLLDPSLTQLRARWSPSLFTELRKTSLQALVCTLPLMPSNVCKEYGLIRRIMWYIEWYSESPYELSVLYWCLRLLQGTFSARKTETRAMCMNDLFDTHGIIVLMHLCHTLLSQKLPLVEKSQVIMSLSLRMITSALEIKRSVGCCVYPYIKWPKSVNGLAKKFLDITLYSLEKHYLVSERFLVAMLNFIWEAIIWVKENRDAFIGTNGVYKLLDLITMTRAPVQCMALALVSDLTRAGDAVCQLITWRASLAASSANPNVVKRGATIATLLASVFRDECRENGISLDKNGVIIALNNFLMTKDTNAEFENPKFKFGKHQITSICIAAADLAGSRMSKAFAILHMLSDDLEQKVSLADEAYNLYKNIKLAPEDEAVLVLCSHYLSMKLNEAWLEGNFQSPLLVPEDQQILEEFLEIGRGWAVEIKRQQEVVIEKDKLKELEEEASLYYFLGRARLNTALDALKEVRCVARSADRERIAHGLLFEAVRAFHRRSAMVKKLDAPVFKTYGPTLDDQNITGQNVKVYSIDTRRRHDRLNSNSS